MTFSEDLKSRVANVYSQGGTTMREIADLFDLSLEDRELVVRYQGKIA
jgi:transposase